MFKVSNLIQFLNIMCFREIFYSLAWTVIGEITLLATGGVRNTLHLIHPAANIAFLQYTFKGIRNKYYINSILFHPEEGSILFCKCIFFTYFVMQKLKY